MIMKSKLSISKFRAERQLEHWSKEVSSKGFYSVKEYILNLVEQMKNKVMSSGEPYEVISEDNFIGFISKGLLIIATENYIEYTINDITTQVSFTNFGMTEELSIVA